MWLLGLLLLNILKMQIPVEPLSTNWVRQLEFENQVFLGFLKWPLYRLGFNRQPKLERLRGFCITNDMKIAQMKM